MTSPLTPDAIEDLRADIERHDALGVHTSGIKHTVILTLLAAHSRAEQLEAFLEEHGDSVDRAMGWLSHDSATVERENAEAIEAFRALRGKR